MPAKRYMELKKMLERAILNQDDLYKDQQRIIAAVKSDEFKRAINSKPRRKGRRK